MFFDMSRLLLATSTVYVASLWCRVCSRPWQPLFELSRHAEACATVSNPLRPPALTLCVASPDFATLMCTLSPLMLMRLCTVLERNVLDITAGKSPTSITYHLQYIKQKCLSSE
ncbi:hypothetical protein EDB89DRAFT_1979983 [Lactarius sanguifluus]|nr:hypothetical protein EDB89DRAFT_1979983 [Lactarius sanguifluus]